VTAPSFAEPSLPTSSNSLTIAGLSVMPASSTRPDAMKVLIHGLPGSGKTTLASSIAAQGKTLFVDLIGERGTMSFRGAPYEKNIDVVRPKSVVELTGIQRYLAKGDHDYTAVVLDSISAAQNSAMRFQLNYDEDTVTEIRKGRQTADQRTWGVVGEIMTDISLFWMALAESQRKKPIHVIFTSQTKMKTGVDGEAKLYPDVSPKSLAAAMAAPDYVFYTDVVEDLLDDGSAAMKHVVRVLPDPNYAIKARIPEALQSKIPPVLGMDGKRPSLTTLGQVLGKISK